MNEDIKGLKCDCPIKILPMAEWVKKDSPMGNCRSCLIAPVAQWYVTELSERGEAGHSEALTKVIDGKATPIQICEKFDEIKAKVHADLRERLKEFDCEVQVNDSEERM